MLPDGTAVEVEEQEKGLKCLKVRAPAGRPDACFLHVIVVPRGHRVPVYEINLTAEVEMQCLRFSRADGGFELRFDPTGKATRLKVTGGDGGFDGVLEDEVVLAGE